MNCYTKNHKYRKKEAIDSKSIVNRVKYNSKYFTCQIDSIFLNFSYFEYT